MEEDRCTEISFQECDVFGGTIRKHPLRYDIAAEVCKLPHLKKLNLRKCKVGGISMMASRSLEYVDISCNDLQEVPSWVAAQKSLRYLSLGANKISLVPDLDHLPLETLKLHKNYLSALPKLGVGIKSLNLYLNKLDRIPDAVFGLSNLEVFTFGVTRMTHLPDLASLPKLRWLTLTVNQIASLPDDVCSLTNLEGLQLAKNRLTRVPDRIGEMVGLKALTLYSNDLTDLPDSFFELKLKKLNVSRNNLDTRRLLSVFHGIDFLEV